MTLDILTLSLDSDSRVGHTKDMGTDMLSLTAKTALEVAPKCALANGVRKAPIGEIADILGVDAGALARRLHREALDLLSETGRMVLRIESHDMPQTLPAHRRARLEAGTHAGFNLLLY